MLLEKSTILGGLGTLGLINLFVPMCNGRGKQIVFGYAEKWLRESAKLGFSSIAKEWLDGEPKAPTLVRYYQHYSPYIFAMQMLEMVKNAGVDLLFDCLAQHPVMEDKRCRGVAIESKSGMEYYGCGMLIDTTGDGDLMRRCGMPTVSRGNFYTFIGKLISLSSCQRAVETSDIQNAYTVISGGNVNLFGDNQPADIPLYTGLTVEEVSQYLISNQLKMLDKLKKTDKNSRDVAMLPMMPQFRTTCRLNGDYVFSIADVYRHFEDSVCAINDFEHRDYLFEVPLRALTRRDFPNILTAGRSASGEGYGWDLLRVIPVAILTGQAAGEAAALALEKGCGVSEVPVRMLQSRLEKQNMMIHFPDAYIPEDRQLIIHGRNMRNKDGSITARWWTDMPDSGISYDNSGGAEGHL